jgi:exonuclease VII small subunit
MSSFISPRQAQIALKMALLSLVFISAQTVSAQTTEKKAVVIPNVVKTSEIQPTTTNSIKNEILKLKSAFKNKVDQSKENREKHRNMRNELIAEKIEDRKKVSDLATSTTISLASFSKRPIDPLLLRIENMRKIADRLDIRIQKIENQEIDLTDARIALAIADVKIDDAEKDIEIILDEATSPSTKSSLKKDIYENARKSMKEAQKSLTDVVETISTAAQNDDEEVDAPVKSSVK